MSQFLSVVAAVLLLTGATATLLAAVGLLRLPDVLARQQSATVPQTVGLACVAAGTVPLVGWRDGLLVLVLVVVLQLATAPVIAQLAGRAGHRDGAVAPGALLADELREPAGGEVGDGDPVEPPGDG